MTSITLYNDDCFNVFEELISKDIKVDMVLTEYGLDRPPI